MATTASLNVLIVDDDEDDALFIKRMLKGTTSKLDVRWVSGYAEALQALLAGGVDAAIIDYRLSGRSGIDLIVAARADGCTTPMILLTGQGDRSVDEEAMRAGAQDYLIKSDLDSSVLERAIRYSVERERNDSLLNRMGRIMDASVNEILLFDARVFRFVQGNTAARRNLGYSLSDLSERTLFDVLEGISRASLDVLFRDLRDGVRDDAVFEAANVRQDGSTYPVEVRLQYFDNERPPLFLATIMDLSERKQREEQILRAQKMEAVGQLAGGLAHDFNNLLTVIAGNLEMIQIAGEKQLQPESAEMIEEAVAAARRGADLTHRLLAFSRQQPLEPVPVNAGRLVANMGELLRRTLGVVVSVETLIKDGLPTVLVDAAQFENALLNLALNARDAMPDGGVLRVEVDAAAQGVEVQGENDAAPQCGWLQVRVSDTGTGIEESVLQQVLEPFFTTKQTGLGNGLGLSMVDGFVRQSGGRIAIESQVGAGTAVTMYLPFVEGDETAVEVSNPDIVRPPGGVECILVVEDDDSVRRLAVLTLSSLGYRVISASSGDEALSVFRGERAVDLLFTDLHMPGNIGGNELVRILREGRNTLPVLVTSGFSESHDYKSFAGVSFIPKPYATTALARRVRAVLDSCN